MMNLKKIIWAGAGLLALACLGILGLFVWVASLESQLPSLGRFEDNAWVMKQVGLKQWTPLEGIAPLAMAAVVASEDDRFFSHKGMDMIELRSAMATDLQHGRYKRGASTLTMQVARNVYLHKQKTLKRKVMEWLIARRLEERASKRRILEVYLNIAEWGPGIYGITPAASHYFSKPPLALTAKEGCFLAMLLPSPVRYGESFEQRSLTRYAKRRIKSLLQILADKNKISQAQADMESNSPFAFESPALVPPLP
jgi:membrane peptidoglycan carboxypeptidase